MSSLLKLPGIKNFYQRYLQKRSDYLKDNRDEVLILYRKLRKAIPPTIDRELAKQGKVAELRWMFKESKNEKFIENIEFSKKVGYEALRKIETGEYPPYPMYYPNPNPAISDLKTEEMRLYRKDAE